MALRLRRGTDAERQLTTPLEGELIYTTDTKILYVGDGVTQGGLQVTGAFPEGIDDLDDVDISSVSPASGQVLKWNGAEFVPDDLFGFGEQANIDIIADDSTVLVDTATQNFQGNTFTGAFIGDGSGLTNLPISVDGSGIVEGSDYRINIIGDDSTILVDSLNKNFNAEDINVNGKIFTSVIEPLNNQIVMEGAENTSIQFNILSKDEYSSVKLTRFSDNTINDSSLAYGIIQFEKFDDNGFLSTSLIRGGDALLFGSDPLGMFGESKFLTWNDGSLGIKTFQPTASLDVNGDAIVRGELTIENDTLKIAESRTIVSAVGSSGDQMGMIAWDTDYIYVCTADYDGSSVIWRRSLLSSW